MGFFELSFSCSFWALADLPRAQGHSRSEAGNWWYYMRCGVTTYILFCPCVRMCALVAPGDRMGMRERSDPSRRPAQADCPVASFVRSRARGGVREAR